MGGGQKTWWIKINISFTALGLHLFVTTIAVTIFIVVAVVFTWSKIVLGDPIISLHVVDAHILRVKHGVYWLKPTNSVR